MTISLNCDAIKSAQMAFEKAGQTASDIFSFAKGKGIPVTIEQVKPRENALLALRENLFEGDSCSYPQLLPCVHTVKANSPYQECQVAADRILRYL